MNLISAGLMSKISAGSAPMLAGSGWSLERLFGNGEDGGDGGNLGSMSRRVGGGFLVVLGIVGIIVAAVKIVTGLINHGKQQTSWLVNILLLVVGAVCMVGGFKTWKSIGSGLNDTVDQMGR